MIMWMCMTTVVVLCRSDLLSPPVLQEALTLSRLVIRSACLPARSTAASITQQLRPLLLCHHGPPRSTAVGESFPSPVAAEAVEIKHVAMGSIPLNFLSVPPATHRNWLSFLLLLAQSILAATEHFFFSFL